MTEVRATREQYSANLGQLQDVLTSLSPAEPNWDELRTTNPAEYAAQKADHAERVATLERVAQERARVDGENLKEMQAAQAEFVQGEFEKLISVLPEWENEAVRGAEIGKLRAFAQEAYGFTDEDLNAVVDHRLLLLLRENQQNRAKTKAGKKEIRKKSKGKPKLKPGAKRSTTGRRTRSNRKAGKAARERLAQSGSVDDAASAIESMLGDDD
jgi:hypothetical protein